jgi:predicted nucleic acid-binding protein
VKSLFADSWFYIALLDERDEYHQVAAAFAARCADVLVTTRWVLAEAANALSRPADRVKVADFLRDLEADPDVRIVSESDALYTRGLRFTQSVPTRRGRSRTAFPLS